MRVDTRLDVRLEEQMDLFDRHVLDDIHMHWLPAQNTLAVDDISTTSTIHTLFEPVGHRCRHRDKDLAHVSSWKLISVAKGPSCRRSRRLRRYGVLSLPLQERCNARSR